VLNLVVHIVTTGLFKVNTFAECALTSCDISHTIRHAAPVPVTTVSQSLQQLATHPISPSHVITTTTATS